MARVIAFRGCEALPLNLRQRRRVLTPQPADVALLRKLIRIRESRPITFDVIANVIDRTIGQIRTENA